MAENPNIDNKDEKVDSTPEPLVPKQPKKSILKSIAGSKELLLLGFVVVVMFFSMMNSQDGKILVEINKNTEVGLNNTDKIIAYNQKQMNDSALRFAISIEKTNSLINNISTYISQNDAKDKQMGIDVINILFLYLKDIDLNQEKIMKKVNVTNVNTVEHNDTNIWVNTTNGDLLYYFDMPFPLNLTNIKTLENRTHEPITGDTRNYSS